MPRQPTDMAAGLSDVVLMGKKRGAPNRDIQMHVIAPHARPLIKPGGVGLPASKEDHAGSAWGIDVGGVYSWRD